MLNQHFEDKYKSDELINAIAILLKNIAQPADSSLHRITIFDYRGSAIVGLHDYLKRINQYMKCSQSCLVLALILLDRLQDEQPFFRVTERNIHKLTMTAVMVAAKSHEDTVYLNTYYAKISGFSSQQLNQLERKFLDLISFKSYINPKIYHEYDQKIRNFIEAQEHLKADQAIQNSETEESILRASSSSVNN